MANNRGPGGVEKHGVPVRRTPPGRILLEIIAAESGAVVKTIGDAVMATFATPDRAIAAALRIRAAIGDLNRTAADRSASNRRRDVSLCAAFADEEAVYEMP